MQKLKTNNNDWSSSFLIDLVNYKKGKKPATLIDEPRDGFIPYVDIEAFEKGLINRYTDDKNATICDKERDILIVWDGRIGLVGKGSGAVGSTLMRLTPKEINRDYLYYFLLSKFREINSNYRGTLIPHINPDYFWNISVPYPNATTQNQIVDKLNVIVPRVEEVKNTVKKARQLSSLLKELVIAAAVTGELTKDLRQESTSKNINPINDLTNFEPHEINGWVNSKLEDIAEHIVDCPHSTPKWTSSGEICVRTTNFKPFHLDLTDVKYVSKETFDHRNSRIIPEEGDILYSREGGILGIACQIPSDARVCLGQRMVLIRAKTSVVTNEYITLFLNSSITLNRVRELITGSAAPRINVSDIKQFNIFLPPLEEQYEILQRVNQYLDLINKIEKQIEAAEKKVSKIMLSILNDTFHKF